MKCVTGEKCRLCGSAHRVLDFEEVDICGEGIAFIGHRYECLACVTRSFDSSEENSHE
jgi:hypothetical protein